MRISSTTAGSMPIGHLAGRLHDRLAQTSAATGFVDVDHVRSGPTLCRAFDGRSRLRAEFVLVVIGRDSLRAKDASRAAQTPPSRTTSCCNRNRGESLARDIHVVPVLVNEHACRRRAELPDFPSNRSLTARPPMCAGCGFGRGAETLVERMREALGDEVPVAASNTRRSVIEGPDQGQWRVRAAIGAAAVAVLFLVAGRLCVR